MKVFQIIPTFDLAGAEVMCKNLCLQLNKIPNVEVIPISLYKKTTPLTKELEESNIKVIYLDKKKGFDYKMVKKLIKLIKTEKPDVIHSHLYVLEYVIPAILLSKFRNIRLVHTIHSIASKDIRKYLQPFQKFLFKKQIVTPVAISEIVKKTIIELYNVDINKVPVVYNGVDLSNCKVKKDYQNFTTILHIGRFMDVKNHFELIDIFEKFLSKSKDKNIKLKLIGEGPLKEEIEKYVKVKNVDRNVVFAGSKANCYQDLYETDVFVLPSKYEGMPMTIIEAMGSGIPVVSYPVGGIPDMICSNHDGILAKDKEDFVASLLSLSQNENLRKKLGENALNTVQKFSSEIMAQKYLKVYEDKK